MCARASAYLCVYAACVRGVRPMVIRSLPRRWWPAPICSIAAVWAFCQSILARWGYGAEYQISAAVVFVAVYIIYSSITSLPFALYKTYVRHMQGRGRVSRREICPSLVTGQARSSATLSFCLGCNYK